jgi:hypothetical protein
MSDFVFDGQTYPLLLNGNAFFKLMALFGSGDIMAGLSSCDFEKLCWAAAILAEQAELDRRVDGHDGCPLLDADRLLIKASPAEAVALKTKVFNALVEGFAREKDGRDDDDVDLGIAEFNIKKK